MKSKKIKKKKKMRTDKVVYNELKELEMKKVQDILDDPKTRSIEKYYLKEYLKSIKYR